MRWIRSLAFTIWLYGLMALLGLLLAPAAVWSREGAYWAIRVYLRLVFAGLERLCGIRYEIRGAPPAGDALIAARHESFLDVLILLRALPRARFVMKRSLVWAPILGFYALRIGASPVTRGKGWKSVAEMAQEAEKRRALGGQLVIFPQGTRVESEAGLPYKPGAHLLYRAGGQPCVPVALSTGLFWPRSGILKRPGVAVVEFLAPLPEGLGAGEFVSELEARIEPAARRLRREARAQFGL